MIDSSRLVGDRQRGVDESFGRILTRYDNPLRSLGFARLLCQNLLTMIPSFVQLSRQERNTASIDLGPSVKEVTAVVEATDTADPAQLEPELVEKRKEFAQYFAQKNIFRARPLIKQHGAIWQARSHLSLRFIF
jgi:hypothetical protein